eukprot:2620756-Lingulodinium_polyedra.AAC.1
MARAFPTCKQALHGCAGPAHLCLPRALGSSLNPARCISLSSTRGRLGARAKGGMPGRGGKTGGRTNAIV